MYDLCNFRRYVGCVIKEVLRMWPPGGTARMAEAGTKLQGGSVSGGGVLGQMWYVSALLHDVTAGCKVL